MPLRNAAPERRRQPRSSGEGEPPRARVVSMILGAFHEMPGLSLHLTQAARLFGLRVSTCELVLTDLVADGKLRRADDGQYRSGGFDGETRNRTASREAGPAATERHGD